MHRIWNFVKLVDVNILCYIHLYIAIDSCWEAERRNLKREFDTQGLYFIL
jgi:hypothetical protein